jgi:putative GTP pyrophosphokinase
MADGQPLPTWTEEYARRMPVFEQLASETVFALNAATHRKNIKTHTVSSRVKTSESIARKAKDKQLADPLAELDDIVGVRVVVLFLSDLPRLDELIHDSFNVISSENKVTDGDPSSFGYMSVHYVVTLDERNSGPRYDDLKGMHLEIQTRTVVMDAWANVSHYLDYKGESSIPRDLRKDFYALSGLFYVADQHFEIFADRSRKSQKEAKKELDLEPTSEIEINLDTFAAFLAQRYPDRSKPRRESISELVEQVTSAGYSDLGALEKDLDKAKSKFEKYEENEPPDNAEQPGRYNPVGVVRVSLQLLGKLGGHRSR